MLRVGFGEDPVWPLRRPSSPDRLTTERPGLTCDPAGLLQWDRRAGRWRRHCKHESCGGVLVGAPAGVGQHGPCPCLRAGPLTDDAPVERGRAGHASHWRRKCADGDERPVGDTDARHAGDGTQMDGQPRPSRVVESRSVHEQHVGRLPQPPDYSFEDRALAQGEETGSIGRSGPIRHHDLVGDVRRAAGTVGCMAAAQRLVRAPYRRPVDSANRRGPPGHRCRPCWVTGPARSWPTGRKGHEAAAHEGVRREPPWRGRQRRRGVTGQRPLESEQVLLLRGPRRSTPLHRGGDAQLSMRVAGHGALADLPQPLRHLSVLGLSHRLHLVVSFDRGYTPAPRAST